MLSSAEQVPRWVILAVAVSLVAKSAWDGSDVTEQVGLLLQILLAV